jgi:hypothetical protein
VAAQQRENPTHLDFGIRSLALQPLSSSQHWLSQNTVWTGQQTLQAETGHLCIFLPKFHCELNPIEMVSNFFLYSNSDLTEKYSTGVGANTVTARLRRTLLIKQRKLPLIALMLAQPRSSESS